MNTTQLECFLAVAKHLNFSKAAEDVKMSQPAVSHQVNALEAELAVKLFNRTSKNVSLTQEGMLFLPDANKIIRIAFSAKDRLSRHEEPLLLEIGCHNKSELDLLPEALKALHIEYPTLRPALHLFPFASMKTLLVGGQVDVMFGMEDDGNQAVFAYRELFRCPVVCICSEDHPLASHTSIRKEEITGSFVFCEPDKITESIMRLQSEIASMFAGNDRYIADGLEGVLAMVKAGFGCTVFPNFPGQKEDGLRYIPVTDCPDMSYGIFACGKQTKLVKRLYQLMKENLKK